MPLDKDELLAVSLSFDYLDFVGKTIRTVFLAILLVSIAVTQLLGNVWVVFTKCNTEAGFASTILLFLWLPFDCQTARSSLTCMIGLPSSSHTWPQS